MPALFQKAASIGTQRVTEHSAELKSAIEARMKGLQEREEKANPKG